MGSTPDAIIEALGLEPHPEGGLFRETWRTPAGQHTARGHGTAIYYLLRAGEVSRWHRVDVTEIWHHYAGAPITLELAANDGTGTIRHTLGSDVSRGQKPQVVIQPGVWQQARTVDGWALAGCTCAPAFNFEGFEMAPTGWRPT